MKTVGLTRAVALLCTACALQGCDWMMKVDAEVRVEPAVQQAIASWPQAVMLRHDALEDDASPGVHRVAVLCAASAEPVAVPWAEKYLNGCGQTATITAWLEPLDAGAGLPCGPAGGAGDTIDPSRVPPAGAPSASARVFTGPASCPHGWTAVLTIAPATP